MSTANPRRSLRVLVLAAFAAALVAPGMSAQPGKLPRVIASANHTLIILPSGAVKVFARSNEAGQLGVGVLGRTGPDHAPNRDYSDEGVYLPGVEDAVDGAAAKDFSLLLRANGTVLAWGANDAGQLGIGATGAAVPRPTPVPLSHVRQLAAGDRFSLALLEDGSVQAWGRCIGEEHACQQPRPRPFAGLTNVTAISAGGDFALALVQDGTVKAWGINKWGQIGDEKLSRSGAPVTVPGLENVAAVSAGEEYALALLRDGTVRVWGQGTNDGAYFAGVRSPSIHEALFRGRRLRWRFRACEASPRFPPAPPRWRSCRTAPCARGATTASTRWAWARWSSTARGCCR